MIELPINKQSMKVLYTSGLAAEGAPDISGMDRLNHIRGSPSKSNVQQS